MVLPSVSAWLLGRDVGALGGPDDLLRVRRCVEWLSTPDSAQLLLAARRGPPTRDGRAEPLLDRLAHFTLGLHAGARRGT